MGGFKSKLIYSDIKTNSRAAGSSPTVFVLVKLFCQSPNRHNIRFIHFCPLTVNVCTDDVAVLRIGQQLVYLYGSVLDLCKLDCLAVNVLVNSVLFSLGDCLPAELYAVLVGNCFWIGLEDYLDR